MRGTGRWETERGCVWWRRRRRRGRWRGVVSSWHRRSEQVGAKLDQNGFGSNYIDMCLSNGYIRSFFLIESDLFSFGLDLILDF